MKAETLEKANSLQREIDSVNTELRELQDGCGIQVTKEGKVYIKTEREWSSKAVPVWLAQKINDALYAYRQVLTERRDNLINELNDL